ncbi:MAG: glycosyltransferase [Faecousia sp.]
MDKKLSFILPIYKVEAYLSQCVDSILSQATPACEIILVDDGSPDGCGAICDAYARDNSDIKVIHKPNGGLSDARNAGFAQATGTYVLFVDSDDYLEDGAVAQLLSWIDSTDCDVAFLRSRKVYPDGTWEPMGEGLIRERILGKPREEVLRFLVTRPKFPASAWGKIYRRAFLLEHGFQYPCDRRLSEDLMYSLDLFLTAQRFDYLDFPYYCYRQNRTGSITNCVTPKYYFDTFLFVTDCASRFAENKKAKDETAALALSFAAYEYAILVWNMLDLTGEDREKAKQLLRQYRWVLDYGQASKTKLVRAAIALLGLDGAARLLDWYMKRR